MRKSERERLNREMRAFYSRVNPRPAPKGEKRNKRGQLILK